ncbi:MAG TPA: glycosyltransferase family 2 protein [Candidatus Bathyarchaeia archaeon]|nr:glycosyltransferase family 2 protein [Candidatus Bathyarchaeia archaeon]
MLTGIVLTKNEEKNIGECLKTLVFCNEVIVVDDYSQDKTIQIAQEMGVKVSQRGLNQDFAAQRNFALDKAKGDWILFIDADERVTPKLKEEIQSVIKNPKFIGYYLKRQDVLFGKKLEFGETANVELLRLARRGSGKWERRVHEVWQVEGKVGELAAPLVHYPHQAISEFLNAINFYSTLHAWALFEERKKSGTFKIICYPLGKFIYNYLIRFGFLDRMPGLIVALMMSLHSFLSWAKLFLLWKKGPLEYQR